MYIPKTKKMVREPSYIVGSGNGSSGFMKMKIIYEETIILILQLRFIQESKPDTSVMLYDQDELTGEARLFKDGDNVSEKTGQ